MLTSIHILLTYVCNWECDHCFLYSGPKARGTFTIAQIRQVLAEAEKMGTVKSIYLEGGEPFLFYPTLVKSLELAKEKGFKTGVVTNCYWATSEEDALLWLDPIARSGLADLSLSDDAFHHGEEGENPAKIALGAAKISGIPARSICIEKPATDSSKTGKGESVTGGGAVLKGRAVETIAKDLPTRPGESYSECTREELVSPRRVHVDPFGNVHICQGLTIGNMFQKPLGQIIGDYRAEDHPLCGPLARGGPAEMARVNGISWEEEFADECHCCFVTRRALLDRYPQYLTPKQVYGI